MNSLSKREKSILCGLYLSKFNEAGLKAFGFDSFKEAFNVLGFAVGAKPASIKNYRDELDPLFPNSRAGWHQRPLREHCQIIYEKYKDWDLASLSTLVSAQTDEILEIDDSEATKESDSFAKRLITGRSAENFFAENYLKEEVFAATELVDVTQSGCGFDFKLQSQEHGSFFAVEVKGMRAKKGQIAFTDKEHRVANEMGTDFFLYVVKNFDESPFAENIRNPMSTNLHFNRIERRVIQVSWNATL